MKPDIRKIKYSLYVIFHPFKGFWDIKRENAGDFISASVLLAILIFSVAFHRQATGFLFNEFNIKEQNIIYEIRLILIILLLWCLSNWCLTTLMDGEGTFLDIYTTTIYALTPVSLIFIPITIISRFLILEEKDLYNVVIIIAILWSLFLLWSGLMTIHQYSASKTLAVFILTLAGMLIIAFLLLLFIDVYDGMIDFVRTLTREIFVRR